MSTKFNKHGLIVNNITSDNITTSDGSKFLNEKESDLKYIGSTTVQNYNWTPDWRNNVRGIDVTSFETPVNGWLSINKSQSPIFVNGKQITTLTNNGSYQSMLKSGDTVTSETEFTYTFAPCKSEMLDWREVPTDYDVWRGAIFRNDDGSVESRDLYIPNATNWKTNVYDANGLTITKVENDKANNGYEFVCNIQTEKIENGTKMFYYCTALTSFSSDLSSLQNGQQMFQNCSALASFNGDLSSLSNGYGMFVYCSGLASFDSDLPSLTNGYYMFYYCSALTSFASDMPNLTNGERMFYYCSALTSFTSDMPNLMEGNQMFRYCGKLESFTSDLSSLTNGTSMFNTCRNLTTFTSNLSSLTNGTSMFNTCRNLTTFTSNLSSLTNGYQMFNSCSALTSFTSDLSSLRIGTYMFKGCKLDLASLENIANTINDLTGTTLEDAEGKIQINHDENISIADLYRIGNSIGNKGWEVIFNTLTFPDYLSIVEGTSYIPDASGWNTNAYTKYNPTIVRVVDGVAYDE